MWTGAAGGRMPLHCPLEPPGFHKAAVASFNVHIKRKSGERRTLIYGYFWKAQSSFSHVWSLHSVQTLSVGVGWSLDRKLFLLSVSFLSPVGSRAVQTQKPRRLWSMWTLLAPAAPCLLRPSSQAHHHVTVLRGYPHQTKLWKQVASFASPRHRDLPLIKLERSWYNSPAEVVSGARELIILWQILDGKDTLAKLDFTV